LDDDGTGGRRLGGYFALVYHPGHIERSSERVSAS
jgi:hypothetical protein